MTTKRSHPPRFPAFLLRLVLPGDVVGEAIRGDLLEEYQERLDKPAARLWYWRQALSVCVWSLAGRLAPASATSSDRPHRFQPQKGEDETMGNILTDVRFALRGFAKRPAIVVTALATLALGLGANAAIFSVVHAVLLQPLPYPEPDRLVALWEKDLETGSPTSISVPNFEDWKANARTFTGMTVINHTTAIVTQGGDGAEEVDVGIVSHDFFDTLGLPLLQGRAFLAEEETEELTRVVILSEELWRRRFGADPGLVGQTIDLEGTSYEVVGIAPRGLETPYLPEVRMWLPAGPWRSCGRGCRRLMAVARLADGVSLAQAEADLGAIAAGLAEEYPEQNTAVGAAVVPLHEQLVGDVRPALLLLLGAVGFVLLLACTNVAHLFLARATTRRSEIAVRTALGASRLRLFRQLLTESAVLALAAGALGLATARLAVPLLLRLAPADVPRLEQVGLGIPVLLFTAGITLLAGLLFGGLPAWRGSRPSGALTAARSGGGARGGSLRDAMIVAEVGLTLTLVVAAGLLAKSFDRLHRIDPGIRAEGVLTANLALPSTYSGEASSELYERLIDRLRSVPGVESAAAIWSLPVTADGREWLTDVSVEGRPELPDDGLAALRPVTPGYFPTIGLPLLRGRDFTAGDDWESPQVAVVSAQMADDLFSGEDPIGQRLSLGLSHRKDRIWEIVGVVGDVKLRGLADDDRWAWYIPHGQARFGGMSVVMRTSPDPMTLAGPLRAAVAEIAPDVVVRHVRTMDDVVMGSIAPQRFNALLLAVFAGLAIVLAAVGIYGVMAFVVSQRTRELGIRVALGAGPENLLRMVVGRGLVLTVLGIAVGTGGALALSRLLEGLLFGVSPKDPMIFAGVAVLTVAMSVVASYPSAWRAARVDPAATLRAE